MRKSYEWRTLCDYCLIYFDLHTLASYEVIDEILGTYVQNKITPVHSSMPSNLHVAIWHQMSCTKATTYIHFCHHFTYRSLWGSEVNHGGGCSQKMSPIAGPPPFYIPFCGISNPYPQVSALSLNKVHVCSTLRAHPHSPVLLAPHR